MFTSNYHNIMNMWRDHIQARHVADWRLWENHCVKIKPKKGRSPRGRRVADGGTPPAVPSCPEDAVDLSLSFIPKQEENDSSPNDSMDLNLANNSMDIKLALGELPFMGGEAMSPFSSSGGEKYNKWPKCAKTYNAKWENDPILKTWIARHPNDSGKVICRYCHSVIRAHKNDLLEHTRTLKHQRNFQQNTDPEVFNMFVMELNGMRRDTPQPPPSSSRKRKSTGNQTSGIKVEFPITTPNLGGIKSEYPIISQNQQNNISMNGHNINGNTNGSSPPTATNGVFSSDTTIAYRVSPPNRYTTGGVGDPDPPVHMEGEDLWQDDDLMSTHLKVILEEPTAADTEVRTHHAWPSRDTLSTSPGNKTQTAKGKGSSVITQEIESMDEEELVSEEDDEFEDEIEEVVVNTKAESPGHGQKQNGRGGSPSPSDSSNLQNHHSHPQSINQEPMYTAQDVIRSLRIGRFNFREVVSLVKAAADAIENPCPPEEQASLGNSRTNATVNNMVDHGLKKGTVRKSKIKTIPNCHPIIIPPSTSRKRKSTTGSNSLSFKGPEDHFQPR